MTADDVKVMMAVAGIPLSNEQAAALAALQTASVGNLAHYPDAALINVEPQIWFRPLPLLKAGRP